MKKLIVLVFVMLVSASSFATKNSKNSNKEVKEKIRTEIVRLLEDSKLNVSSTLETTVEFLINAKSEIIILNLSNKDAKVAEYVKSKLNNKKITIKKGLGHVFKMSLKIVK